MTTKHTIEKRLERLEAEREARRMSSVDQFDGDIDEALVDEVIKLSRAQLKGSSDSDPGEIPVSLPAALQALDDGESDEDEAI